MSRKEFVEMGAALLKYSLEKIFSGCYGRADFDIDVRVEFGSEVW